MTVEFIDRLVCADCTDYLKTLPSGCVDLACPDPPYNIGYDYAGEYKDNRNAQEFISWCATWLAELYRTLKPCGTCWVAMGPAMVSEVDIAAKHLGFHKRSQICWHFTFGRNMAKKLTPSSVFWLYYTKHKTEYTFNHAAERVPSARQMVYNDSRAKVGGRTPDDVWYLRPQWAPDHFDPAGDVWFNPRIAGTFKESRGTPNQMPEQIMGRIIRLCSNEGDIVCDPFAGSGTTLAVAKKLGRRYTGCELSRKFYEISTVRLEESRHGDTLSGKTESD